MPIYREREDDFENLLNRGALWAVTYGDLMSYLMIFFLLMFVFSISGGAKFEEGMADIQEAMGGLPNKARIERAVRRDKEEGVATELQRTFASYGIESVAEVTITAEKLRITLREPILFDPGTAYLRPSAIPVLRKITELVARVPDPIVIEGHTDNVRLNPRSEYSSNWQLSMARAYTVLRYFADVADVEPTRLSGVGYGEHRPVAPNNSEKNRSMNRRIEISLIRAR